MSNAVNQTAQRPSQTKAEVDVVVVGAGFAGMYMIYKLRELGMTMRAFEAASDVGGTWYWNRYPGARCDVESMEYSYSFSEELQQEWKWSERYSTQPEILRYAQHVADRFGLRPDIQFNTRVSSAIYDEQRMLWLVRTEDGESVTARYCIMAAGCLSAPRKPDIRGIDSFAGVSYHTGQWPHEGVDFTGKRVGVIGTGSTGIQAIPMIARDAKHVYVFQRTPNFSVPAHNKALDPKVEAETKRHYPEMRRVQRSSASGVSFTPPTRSALSVSEEERLKVFEEKWQTQGGATFLATFNDTLTNLEANATIAEFVRSKIRSIVKDEKTAEALAPTDHPIGTKRICVDTGYFETYNRDNVTLVDVRKAPIEEFTPQGLRTSDVEYEFDCMVFATGFDAMTGALLSIDIRGRNGLQLKHKWEAGPRTYLGLCTVGFPNLFMVTGPGSPSVLSNMIMSIEQHVDWIADCLAHMRKQDFAYIEPRKEFEDGWVKHVNEVADATLYKHANSWYLGANIPGKARVFMPYVGGFGAYRQRCDEVAAKGYEGFVLGVTNKEAGVPVSV